MPDSHTPASARFLAEDDHTSALLGDFAPGTFPLEKEVDFFLFYGVITSGLGDGTYLFEGNVDRNRFPAHCNGVDAEPRAAIRELGQYDNKGIRCHIR